jgi:hypothetical protein
VIDVDVVGLPLVTSVKLPEEDEFQYTLYPVAPETAFQLMVMLVFDAVAVNPVGVPGADTPVVAEGEAD